jgi:hypothetical protein
VGAHANRSGYFCRDVAAGTAGRCRAGAGAIGGDLTRLDLISQGRAEIITGRGSFIESYPLFGFDLRIGEWNDQSAAPEILSKVRAVPG